MTLPSAAEPPPGDPLPPAIWSDRDAAFFADHLAGSDYVEKVGGRLAELTGPVPSLLDIGAGSGILGARLLAAGGSWTAIEPNAHMRGRIAALAAARGLRLALHDTVWQALPAAALAPADLVLCANIPGTTGEARRVLEATRPLARGALAWVVSAQAGPRTYCLSGFLPAAVHGSDMRPGYLLTLAELGAEAQPDEIAFADWSFLALFPTRAAALAHFLEKLGPELDPTRRRALDRHLDTALAPTERGWLAIAPKRSAILIWRAPAR